MPLKLAADQLLSSLTSLRLGGPARHFARVESRSDLGEAVGFARARDLGLAVLGGGSNVLIPDSGLDGLVIQIALHGRHVTREGSHIRLRLGAGEGWDDIVAWTVEEGWSGLECLSGIPGLVGATPIQNVGAYGAEIADSLRAVEVVDLSTWPLVTHRIEAGACAFAYRDSRFKHNPGQFVITAVELELGTDAITSVEYEQLRDRLGADRAELSAIRRSVLELRRSKGMVLDDVDDENQRSVGSFFLNPVVNAEQMDDIVGHLKERGRSSLAETMPSWRTAEGLKLSAGWLIEASGMCKGMRRGGVGISSRHALALVHHGKASTAELLDLAAEVQARVQDTFGLRLRREPRHLMLYRPWRLEPEIEESQ